MPENNKPAPNFELPDLDGQLHRLSDQRGKIAVVNFWSCECMHSERTDRSMVQTFIQWNGSVVLLTVACNRNETPDAIREEARRRRLPLVLMDAGQTATNLYEAVVTPHAFVIDRQGILRYQGAVDDVAYQQRNPTRFYVQEVVEALLAGRLPAVEETLAFGCAIVREI